MTDKTVELKNAMKALPLADSDNLKSLHVLTIDSDGTPQRRRLPELNVVELHNAEECGAKIPLKDFTVKYIERYAPGMILSDTWSNTATVWSIVLPNGDEIDLQRYMVLILKASNSLTSQWGYARFLLLPNSRAEPKMYLVCQETKETADQYLCQIFKVPFEAVYST